MRISDWSSDVCSSDLGLGLALDFGPLLVFFLGYKFFGVFAGTAIFMVAIIIAVLVSKFRLGHVSPMLWLTAILVIGFGGLTIYLQIGRASCRERVCQYV